jgi:hypothetical protein
MQVTGDGAAAAEVGKGRIEGLARLHRFRAARMESAT